MPRRYLLFGLVSLALLMASINNTIVQIALPAMRSGLGTSLLLIGWTVTIFQLGQLLVMPVAGKLADELGRKRVFLASVALFTVSSALCGLAPNVYVLIVFRALQAIGGGAFLPTATGIVADAFKEQRMKAIGLFSSVFPIGGVIGPNIGGLLIDQASWRWVFYVNVPIGAAVLVLTWLLYHPEQKPPVRRPIDFLGIGLYGTAITAVLVSLTWMGKHPQAVTRAPLLWAVIAGAAALFVLWYRHEARTTAGMVDITLLRSRPFLAANLYNFLFGAGVFGFSAFLPTYAVLHYGMSATLAGTLLTPRAIAMMGTSTVAALFLLRFGYRLPMIVGVLAIALSLVLTGLGPRDPTILGVTLSSAVYLAITTTFIGFGFGLSGPASSNAALDIMPDKVSAITGLRGMFRQTGGTIGTAVVVFLISLFADEAYGLQVVFIGLGAFLLLVIPVVFLIPDGARDLRRAGRAAEEERPAVRADATPTTR